MAQRIREEKQQFEDVSSYSSSEEYKKHRKGRKGRVIAKSIAAFFCVLVIAFGAGLIYISTELIDGLSTTSITKTPEELGIDPNNVTIDDSIKNIALFGVDSRNGKFTGQSDVVMVLTVDNKHRKLKMTSILRDSRVSIEGIMLSGASIDTEDKINSAYANGGYELAIRTLNRNFNLNIENYVTINFANMSTIVDAFGGVEIEVSDAEVQEINSNLWALVQEIEDQKADDEAAGNYNETYPEIKHEDFFQEIVGGTYLLNGNQAVAYGRIRHLDSDDLRAKRQQRVFKALISRVKDISITEYPNLIKQMMPLCETSLGVQDVIGLVPILTSSFEIEATNIPDHIHEIVTEMNYDYIYDTGEAARRIDSFIYEEGSPYWSEFGDTASEDFSGTVDGTQLVP